MFVYEAEDAPDALALFLTENAGTGEKRLYLAQDAAIARKRISIAGFPIDGIDFVSLSDWYLTDDKLDPDAACEHWRRYRENALAQGHDGVIAVADFGSFFASREELRVVAKCEARLNALIPDLRIHLVCAYRRSSLGKPVFGRIAASHQVVAYAVTREEVDALVRGNPDLAPGATCCPALISDASGLCFAPSENGGSYVATVSSGKDLPLSGIVGIHRYLIDRAQPDRARITRQAKELSMYLEAMGSVVDASPDGLDLHAIMHDIVARSERALEADGARIYLLNGSNLEPQLSVGESIKDEEGLLVPLARRAAESGRILSEPDRQVILHQGLSHVTLIAFPLRASVGEGTPPAGAMVLATQNSARAAAWENQPLVQLGEQLGLVLERALLRNRGGAADSVKAAKVIQATADGIMVVDEEQRIENVNPALESLTGFSRDELLGQSCHNMLQCRLAGGEYLCDTVCPLADPPYRGPNTLEATIRKRDGDACWVDVTIIPMYDSAGHVIGSVYTLRDITERKETDRLKDDFISLVSHEFRSPVTVIMGMASTLLRKEMPLLATARSGLRDILAQARRLNRLVDNLLIITRSRAGNLEITPEYVRVERIGAKLIKDLQGQSRLCSFTMDFPRDFPPAFVDPVRLELVLRNLLENAVRYSPDGGAIRLWGRREDSLIVIGVEDQGMGIPARYLESIFQSFYRLEDPRVQAKPGIGLGLAASQRVIVAHGGRIWAESEPGKGSRFAFALPAQRKFSQE